MPRMIVALLLSVLITSFSHAQTVQDEKKASHAFRRSEKYLKRYDFYKALPYLKQAANLAPNNANYSFHLGKAMFETGEIYAALPHFIRSYKFDNKVSPEIDEYLARTSHLNGKYSNAIPAYERHLMHLPEGSPEFEETKLAIAQCKSAIGSKLAKGDFEIRNLGEFVNSRFHEYGSTFGEDDSYMLFTSRRPRNLNSFAYGLYNQEDMNEEVYHARKSDDSWMQTRVFTKPIPMFTHDAPVALADDGNTLVYYADKNYGDIFVSHKEGDKWSKRESIGAQINTEEYHEPSVFITPGGTTLYFVSNRPGGEGNLDIYMSTRSGEASPSIQGANWGEGSNLGTKVNTPADEDAPFVTADGKHFYFSSTGHNSIGGFDIFRCDRLPDGSWSDAVNLGVPINSPGDDIFYVQKEDGKGFYFSSDRPFGFGGMDIYYGEAADPSNAASEPLMVMGTVLHKKTGDPVAAEVTVVDINTNDVVATEVTNASTGGYSIEVPKGTHEYRIDVKMTGGRSSEAATNSDVGKMNILSGNVVDEITRKPIVASIDIIDPRTNALVKTLQSGPLKGSYITDLESGHNYILRVKNSEYMPYSEEFRVSPSGEIEAHQFEIALQPVNSLSKLVLNWQFFSPKSSDIRTEHTDNLDDLAQVMKNIPSLKLEIVGHTDSDADPLYNQALSEARATSVANYLIQKGVEKERLTTKGKGETSPLYPNNDPENKKYNRRVELFILK